MEMLLQPFFEEVLSVGEHALVFLAGRYSHAFCKQCALSEEDRQAEHPITAAPAEIRCAGQVLVAIARLLHLPGPEALLFARVDLVPDRRGHYCLMEVELTEPRLRLEDRPTAGDQLASALLRRLDRSRSASRGT